MSPCFFFFSLSSSKHPDKADSDYCIQLENAVKTATVSPRLLWIHSSSFPALFLRSPLYLSPPPGLLPNSTFTFPCSPPLSLVHASFWQNFSCCYHYNYRCYCYTTKSLATFDGAYDRIFLTHMLPQSVILHYL